jgi:hypothetical protein
MPLAEIQQRRKRIERWSELPVHRGLGAAANPTRWIEAGSPQRIEINAFHPQLHDSG